MRVLSSFAALVLAAASASASTPRSKPCPPGTIRASAASPAALLAGGAVVITEDGPVPINAEAAASCIPDLGDAKPIVVSPPPSAPAPAMSPAESHVGILRAASYNPPRPAPSNLTESLHVISRTYDDFDRLGSETVDLEGGGTATVSYTYYRNGLRKTVTDTQGRVTFYEYNGRRLLSRVTTNQGLPDQQVTSYDYWPDNLVKAIHRPNGVDTAYTYDLADRVETIVVSRGATRLVAYEYGYDDNGNRLSQVEENGGPPETTTYGYDDLDRLTEVRYPDGKRATYGYDAVGNRTAEKAYDASNALVSDKTAVFDAVNRLTSVTDAVDPAGNASFTYDHNGNLLSKTTAAGTQENVYDTRDLLVETREGTAITARYAYDGLGRRYLKIGEEGIRQYLYDQTSTLEELDENDVEVAKYEYGSTQLASFFRRDEPRRFYHLDALGSVTALSDGGGDMLARYHLDAWGNFRDPAELEASRNRFAFTGYLFDRETNLYYAKARYYDPVYGRFTSQDNVLGQVDDPPSLNRYYYGNANPGRYVDPTGHDSVLPGLQGAEGQGLERISAIGQFKQGTFKHDPQRFADALTDEEGFYLDKYKVQRLDANHLNAVEIKEARTLFGDNKDSFEQYANYQARSQLISRYALTDKAMVGYYTDLWRLTRDVGPATVLPGSAAVIPYAAERAYETATGQEAFTGQETGRLRPALELATMYALGKGADFLLGKSLEPGSFAPGIGSRGAGGAAQEEGTLIGTGQRIVHGDDGSLHIVGEQGQPLYGGGKWRPTPGSRDLDAQANLAGKLPGDHAGHLLPSRGGFEGPRENLTPMAGKEVNQGTYARMENFLGRMRRAGHDVEQEVIPVYTNNPLRADKFVVTYRIDNGSPVTLVIDNPATRAGTPSQRK